MTKKEKEIKEVAKKIKKIQRYAKKLGAEDFFCCLSKGEIMGYVFPEGIIYRNVHKFLKLGISIARRSGVKVNFKELQEFSSIDIFSIENKIE